MHTLLIVDDEPAILSSLKRALRLAHCTVLTAASGEEGLELMRRQAVAVVMSDGLMVGMTGVQFLHHVEQEFPATVRIMLTGYTDPTVVAGAEANCHLFALMTKPWDNDELLDTLRRAFQHYEEARTA